MYVVGELHCIGMTRRDCLPSGVWSKTNLRGCVSKQLHSLLRQVTVEFIVITLRYLNHSLQSCSCLQRRQQTFISGLLRVFLSSIPSLSFLSFSLSFHRREVAPQIQPRDLGSAARSPVGGQRHLQSPNTFPGL